MNVFKTLCGLFFLGVLGTFFYWLYWDEDAKAYSKDVQEQVAVLESFWNSESKILTGRLNVGYEGIAQSGFPFGMRVRLLKPYLQDTNGDTTVTLMANYLDLLPQDEKGTEYKIEYPLNGDLVISRGSAKQHYYLLLSDMPPLYVQKVEVGGRVPSAVNQYGIQFPSQLVLTVDANGKNKQLPFAFTATEQPLYRPIIRYMRENLLSFTQFVQQAGR